MGNTPQGRRKAAQTLKKKYGEDYFRKLASKSADAWEKNGRKPKGTATMDEKKRKEISRKGGLARKGYRKGIA